MLHGWPSSFVQMLPLVPRLTDSERHGGGHDDAFKVVAMSLPGDGFSDRPSTRGWDVARIADAAADVMTQLGYDRFAVRGSDLGAGVLQQLALRNLRRLVALHLSGTNPYLGWVPDDLRRPRSSSSRRRRPGTRTRWRTRSSTRPDRRHSPTACPTRQQGSPQVAGRP